MSEKKQVEITMQEQKTYLNWELGESNTKEDSPASFFIAEVPGAVQLDYQKKNNWPDISVGNNVNAYKALEAKYWHYKTQFEKPELREKEELIFRSKGIDYEFDILINGTLLLHQEGMFSPVELKLDTYLQDKNILEVIIYPIPIVEGAEEGRRQAAMSAKPAVGYGWDWHPRLIPVGIWDETYLEILPKTRIIESELNYQLNEDLSVADILMHFVVSNTRLSSLTYEWELYDAKNMLVLARDGNMTNQEEDVKIQLENPLLWWPHDHGTPNLYTCRLILKDAEGTIIDQKDKRVGFRKVEMVLNPGTELEAEPFPKTERLSPFTIKINNKQIFTKGTNWVHPELFYGTITKERYKEQLVLVKECNMNLVRIWGGGITNKDSFHSLCDELGIMLWAEFPLACNDYPNDSHYLEILEQEAKSIIKKVKPHPSLVIWSGGNELLSSWSGMTVQSHALRLLNSMCYQYDKDTPYINTSPLNGVGHGHYIFYDKESDEDVFQLMQHSSNTAYTEFGMPSLAPVEVLKQIIPENELFPVEPTESWNLHNAFDAWQEDSWLEKPTIEKYFGKAKSLEELVEQSQSLQSIGYKAIFEEARRQKPYCSMAMNWCLNEPWPNAANNNLITYPNHIKPAYYAVKESLRPVMASAAFQRFDYKSGEEIEIDLWLLNDSFEAVVDGKMEVEITIDGKIKNIGEWSYNNVIENSNKKGPTIRYAIPPIAKKQLVEVSVKVSGNKELDSNYFVLIKEAEPKKNNDS